jgi:hypothetical protein
MRDPISDLDRARSFLWDRYSLTPDTDHPDIAALAAAFTAVRAETRADLATFLRSQSDWAEGVQDIAATLAEAVEQDEAAGAYQAVIEARDATITDLRAQAAERERAFAEGVRVQYERSDAREAELLATLANERGEGAGPSGGWVPAYDIQWEDEPCDDPPEAVTRWEKRDQTFCAFVGDNCDGDSLAWWAVHFGSPHPKAGQRVESGIAPNLRAAMKAADSTLAASCGQTGESK